VSALVLAAILKLAPLLELSTAERYAADIAAACGDEADLCFALVATQHVESSWSMDVETCVITGDGGRAVSAFQLQKWWWAGYTRAEICSSNRLAVWLAASTLTVLSHRTGGTIGALRAYVGCAPGDPRSVKRIKAYRLIRGVQ
jgi:hypothetical protein